MAVFSAVGEMGLLRKAGLSGETARQHRTTVPAVEQSFGLQRPHVPPYGHFGGLDDAGELTERHRSVGAHHFEDQSGDVLLRTRN